MEVDGFLFFKGLLPRAAILNVRRQILEVCEGYGWVEGGDRLMDGIPTPAAYDMVSECGVGVTKAAYQDIYKLEDFHRLAHHPSILSLMEALCDEPVFTHPRHIARMMFPVPANAPTPPHQDHIFIQGTKTAYTCWLPAGDFPTTLGGLSVFRGSHKLGLLPVRAALGAGGRSVILDGIEQTWALGDFEAGDALVFHSLTVHKAVPNQFPDRLRLSVDYRYQPLSMPIEEKSLKTHCDMMGWDEVYAGWPTDDLKYYWRQHAFEYQEFDWSLLEVRTD
jgi:hypothetical protein